MISDRVPSEAAFSRLITKLEEHDTLQKSNESILFTAFHEGFIEDDTLAIDATHVKAHEQAPPSEKKVNPEPKKRGRKSKDEREQWLKEQQERNGNLTLYEKDIEAQLDVSLLELRKEMLIHPQWGIKKNSEGKNVFW